MTAARLFVALVALCASPAVFAQFDYAVSGFGTVGYATSNSPDTYVRYVNDRGTFLRDSVAGLQIDAKAFDEFGATVQFKVAPYADRDNKYTASVSWAFGSWRPTNDWLIRVGKQRTPYYLYSQSLDVGASYDFARLPIEMYSISASDNFIGLAIGHTWHVGDWETSLDGYGGYFQSNYRVFTRDTVPGVQTRGAQFLKLDFRGVGLVASVRDDENQVRFSVIRAYVKNSDGSAFVGNFPFVQVAPGIGYYQVSNALPGPGVGSYSEVQDYLITFGADLALPYRFRLTAEFERTIAKGTPLAPRGNRGYLALSRRIDKFTPYVYYAFLRSPQGQIDEYTRLNDNALPAFIPGAAQINASQRGAADGYDVQDQSSWAFGSSYSLTPTSKLKAEYLRTRIGAVSQLLDVAQGDTPRHRKFNTWSLSYSVVFQ